MEVINMSTNVKKGLKLKNNTKYFSPDTSRAYVRFGSPLSYESRKIKIEGYEARLYWQFRYCEDNNGQAFFYTLTYNDKSMPKYMNNNVFDYEDLRDLLTGGFYQNLRRNYGTKFKYFVGAELGDGKGKRGIHNNPHYHIIFFLEPDDNPLHSYEKISPEEFRHLVKIYWQGFDETREGYRDYNQAKYGIAKEGENCGLVTDYRACCYCAKYVTKDVKLKRFEHIVERNLRYMFTRQYKGSVKSYDEFYDEYIEKRYNIPLDAMNTTYQWKWYELVRRFLGENWFSFEDEIGIEPLKEGRSFDIMTVIKKLDIYEDYCSFCRKKVDDKVRLGLNTYRNRYCNKCRISQGVGSYALNFIDDYFHPTVQVPSKKGFKNRPLPLYLYRKLYTEVVHPTKVTHRGTIKRYAPVRVLNDLGIEYKVSRLDEQIEKLKDNARGYYNIIINNEDLFERIRESDINTEVLMHYSDFLKEIKYLLEEDNNIDKLLQRYAEFKFIYEDRFLPFQIDGHCSSSHFPTIDIYSDYRRFITPTVFSVTRSDLRLEEFLESNCSNYLPYYSHPYFLRYVSIFSVFDMCSDYFFVQGDNKAQREAEEKAEIKRFHDRLKLKQFYADFVNN